MGFVQIGKSSLAVQFVDGHFVDSYYPTIENTFTKNIRYKGQDFTTEIVDTAGQVSFPQPPSCARQSATVNKECWADRLTFALARLGQDEYSILNSKHFIGIHGYMLVYSVASLPTFEMVQVIRDKILDRLVSLAHPLRPPPPRPAAPGWTAENGS